MIKGVLTSEKLAKQIVVFAEDKKAEDIVVLDMRDVVNFCDYFVICSGTSDRQVRAIADGIDQGITELGMKVRFKQGFTSKGAAGNPDAGGAWVLLDLGDVVVHVFEPQSREFYGLEHLWQDAKEVKWPAKRAKKSK